MRGEDKGKKKTYLYYKKNHLAEKWADFRNSHHICGLQGKTPNDFKTLSLAITEVVSGVISE